MRRIIVFLSFLIFIPVIVYGQGVTISTNYDKKFNSVSTSLHGGRYEFIQSDIVARQSFKVDKYNGDVYQLVIKEDSTYTWDLIPKEKSTNDIKELNKINYQLYMSGLAAKYCFLLNVNTGVTWQFVKYNYGYYFESIR